MKWRHVALGVAGVSIVVAVHWLRDPSSVRGTLMIAVAVLAAMAVFEYFMRLADRPRKSR